MAMSQSDFTELITGVNPIKERQKLLNIVKADWMPVGDAAFITNGVDVVARLDGTNKEARYEIKKPKMVIAHTGETKALKKLRSSQLPLSSKSNNKDTE